MLPILSYLPIILLGVGGSVIVIDMWHIAEVGRTKVSVVKNEHQGAPTITPSAAGNAPASPSR